MGTRNGPNFYFRVQRSCSIRSGSAYTRRVEDRAPQLLLAGADARAAVRARRIREDCVPLLHPGPDLPLAPSQSMRRALGGYHPSLYDLCDLSSSGLAPGFSLLSPQRLSLLSMRPSTRCGRSPPRHNAQSAVAVQTEGVARTGSPKPPHLRRLPLARPTPSPLRGSHSRLRCLSLSPLSHLPPLTRPAAGRTHRARRRHFDQRC